jgi:hypothetical protein
VIQTWKQSFDAISHFQPAGQSNTFVLDRDMSLSEISLDITPLTAHR